MKNIAQGIWPVQPWLFIPKHCKPALESGLVRMRQLAGRTPTMPPPRVTFLEEVVGTVRNWYAIIGEKERQRPLYSCSTRDALHGQQGSTMTPV